MDRVPEKGLNPPHTSHTPKLQPDPQGTIDFTCGSIVVAYLRLRSIEADTILYNSGISACVKGHLFFVSGDAETLPILLPFGNQSCW
jgi:hypothetical protein